MLGAARRDQEGLCTPEVAQPGWQLGFRPVSLGDRAVSTKLWCHTTAAPRREYKPWVFALSSWSLVLSRNWFLPYGCHPLHSSVPLSRDFPITLEPIKIGRHTEGQRMQAEWPQRVALESVQLKDVPSRKELYILQRRLQPCFTWIGAKE